MNIGVYGDSFTVCPDHLKESVWYNILAKKLKGKVSNFEKNLDDVSYGLGASPTYYSYKKFLKYHDKHDINILVVSDPLKYPKLVKINGNFNAISGINNIEHLISISNNPEDIRILQDLKTWYMVSDVDFMYTAQDLLLQDIETRSFNKIILIPAHENCFISSRKNKIGISMWEVVAKQNADYLKIPHEFLLSSAKYKVVNNENPNTIAAHFTKETNHLVANLLYEYITTGKKIVLPDNLNHDNDWTYYYSINQN